VARSILHDDSEAEDVLQDAYVKAYQHLRQFAGYSSFATWLTRIAVHEALRRLPARKRALLMEEIEVEGEDSMGAAETSLNPEQNASLREVGHLLEDAVLHLPERYRSVIMMRDIEEMSTADTAAALDLTEENVKVRLHRGHAMMRDLLCERVGAQGKFAFPFMGRRCDRVVLGVFARLRSSL
jgi:RNA polymerase sigma-70 factor (ECF subfamily)